MSNRYAPIDKPASANDPSYSYEVNVSSMLNGKISPNRLAGRRWMFTRWQAGWMQMFSMQSFGRLHGYFYDFMGSERCRRRICCMPNRSCKISRVLPCAFEDNPSGCLFQRVFFRCQERFFSLKLERLLGCHYNSWLLWTGFSEQRS